MALKSDAKGGFTVRDKFYGELVIAGGPNEENPDRPDFWCAMMALGRMVGQDTTPEAAYADAMRRKQFYGGK